MSYQASSWVAEICDVTSGEKLLLFAIANRVDECGVGFPGRERLAREACCRPETVTSNMRRLVDRGLVARFERRRENGSRTSDWIVLAPLRADRVPLQDAIGSDYPAELLGVARRGSGEESAGEVSAPGQVRKTGGPEQSEEQSDRHSSSTSASEWLGVGDEMRADGEGLLKAKRKVATRIVTEQEMMVAAAALAEFNRQAKADYGLGANLTSIVMRIRDRPSWDAAKHVRLVQSAWRIRWWERRGDDKRRAGPNVIYGEGSFDKVVQDAADEAHGTLVAPVLRLKDRLHDGMAWDELPRYVQDNLKENELMRLGYEDSAALPAAPALRNGNNGSNGRVVTGDNICD